MSQFINIHKWNNATQGYDLVGYLVYDGGELTQKMQWSTKVSRAGNVSFHYDKTYIRNGGAALDPKHLDPSINGGVYVHTQGGGRLPAYFEQFLPGAFSRRIINQTLPQWSTLNDFELLNASTRIFGDHHAIHLNAQNPQHNTLIQSIDELEVVANDVHQLLNSNTRLKVKDETFMTLCGMTGKRPKLDFGNKHDGQRHTLRLNSINTYPESHMRDGLAKMCKATQVDVVDSRMLTLGSYGDVVLQRNFKHDFLSRDNSTRLLKFNTVPFSGLLENNDAGIIELPLTYQSAIDIIDQYSAEPDIDKTLLFKRALFGAHINHVNNGLDNLHFIDIGVNEFRLAPATDFLTEVRKDTAFLLAYSKQAVSGNHFIPDQQFAAALGTLFGVNEELAYYQHQAISDELHNLEQAFGTSREALSAVQYLKDVIDTLPVAKTGLSNTPPSTSANVDDDGPDMF